MTLSTHPAADAATILREIEVKLGFVPPFFEPAIAQPELLLQLWRHTLSAYLDNPLPALLKEKIAAAVGRYCAIRYCMMCHMCTLRPLGMQPADITALMTRATPSAADVMASIERLTHSAAAGIREATAWDTAFEGDVIDLAISIYRSDALASLSRKALEAVMTPGNFNHLVSFISYNHMCHDWVEAHSQISFELDRRYIDHYAPLTAEMPQLQAQLDARISDAGRLALENALQITDVKSMEELSEQRLNHVLRDLTARLDAARSDADAQQLTATFAQELLAIVSHDLRNPLGAISNAAFLLAEHADPKVLTLGNIVKRSADRALALIRDLLDFSQARVGGGIPCNAVRMSIHELLEDIVWTIKRSDPDRVVALKSDCPGMGYWDPERLHQVFVNLMVNALKHSPKDSEVSIRCRKDATEARIEISNRNRNGAIPDVVRRTMFEPFQRFSAEGANPNRSVGLGLYIVNQIVTGHAGRMEVESDAALTVFRVILPNRTEAEAL